MGSATATPGVERRRNRARTQTFDMAAVGLTVEDPEAPHSKLDDQRDQRGDRRAGACMEHRLPRKIRAQGHAVDATDELAVLPGFHRVSEPQIVQLAVGSDHVRRYPRPRGIRAARVGAGSYHTFEVTVHAQLKSTRGCGARENNAAPFVEHHARVGREPENRLAVMYHGKIPLA
jgi:hypothetical protein